MSSLSSDPAARARVDRALESLDPALDPLQVATLLRRAFPTGLAREATELFALRRRAAERLPSIATGFLTRKGLEQATREPVARARAAHLRRLAPKGALVLDATCGIGSDSIALAAAGLRVVAADMDLEHARFARLNLERAAPTTPSPNWVIVADARKPAVLADFLVLDPDRRADGARALEPERWAPPLSRAVEIAAGFAGACLKLHPALDVERLLPHLERHFPRSDWRLQWVSHQRELCEFAVWTGTLSGTDPGTRGKGEREALATRSTSDETTRRGEQRIEEGLSGAHLRGWPAEVASWDPREVSEISWLAEPDPAVIRSGLLGVLARSLDLAPVGPAIAYLGGRERPESPLLRSWRVLGSAPLDRRRVRALLAEHDVGPLQVMKRGHPDRGEVLERRLRGSGSRRGLLAVTRLESGHRAFLLEPRADLARG